MNQTLPWTEFKKIPIGEIHPSAINPRENFDEADLQDLAGNIQQYGILQPIIVRPDEVGFEIIAGERRYRAAKIAGIAIIPAMVRGGFYPGQDQLVTAIENALRRDLNPIETANGYKQLVDMGVEVQAIAEAVGKSHSVISNSLRLLTLPEHIQVQIRTGRLSETAGRALLTWIDYPDLFAHKYRQALDGVPTRELEKVSFAADEKYIAQVLRIGVGEEAVQECARCPHSRSIADNPACLKPECLEEKRRAWAARDLKAVDAEQAASTDAVGCVSEEVRSVESIGADALGSDEGDHGRDAVVAGRDIVDEAIDWINHSGPSAGYICDAVTFELLSGAYIGGPIIRQAAGLVGVKVDWRAWDPPYRQHRLQSIRDAIAELTFAPQAKLAAAYVALMSDDTCQWMMDRYRPQGPEGAGEDDGGEEPVSGHALGGEEAFLQEGPAGAEGAREGAHPGSEGVSGLGDGVSHETMTETQDPISTEQELPEAGETDLAGLFSPAPLPLLMDIVARGDLIQAIDSLLPGRPARITRITRVAESGLTTGAGFVPAAIINRRYILVIGKSTLAPGDVLAKSEDPTVQITVSLQDGEGRVYSQDAGEECRLDLDEIVANWRIMKRACRAKKEKP